MKNLNFIIFVSFFIILLFGCRNDVSRNSVSVPEVNIDIAETRSVKLSELVQSCEFVYLDSDTTAILNRPSSIAISEKYILITDWENFPAKLFTRSGEFIKNIGKIGHGPDEYLSVVSPFIDEVDNAFWLLLGGNYSNNKDGWYYVYNLKGEIIQRINAFNDKDKNRNGNDVLVFKKQLLKPGNVQSQNMLEYKSLISNKEINITNRINKDYFTYTTNNSRIYPTADNFIFKIGESDTIYSFNVESEEVKPIISVLTKSHRFDENKINEARKTSGNERFSNIQKAVDNCYSIQLLGETQKYYLLSVAIMGASIETKVLLVDKDTHDVFYGNIENDFLGNMVIKQVPLFYLNDYIVFHFPAIMLMDEIKQRIVDVSDEKELDSLRSIYENINQNDNEIFLICEI